MRVPRCSPSTWVATLVAWPARATLLIALTAGLAQAQTAVYYSVGTNAADLKNAANVTIAAGTATFTVAQPDHVGVGDQVTYNGATVAYISGRTSSTVYTVTTATGAAPTPGGPWVVNSILRAFNSLANATRNADDGTHLNGSNLPALDVQLNLPCYNDGPDPSARVQVRETGSETWTTDATHYIRIYTPTTTSEVGVSQRHDGRAGTGYRIAPTGPAGVNFFNFIYVGTGNVRIEGLEIDGSGLTNAGNVRGIMVNRDLNPMDDVRISHNLIHDLTNTIDYDGVGQADLIGIRIEDVDNATVWNNIVYNLTNGSLHANSDTKGIQSASANGMTHYVYNNTVYNIDGGQRPVWGILDINVTMNAKNNYVGLVTSTTTNECYNGPFLNAAGDNYNVSSDGTASGTGSQTGQSAYASYFVSVVAGSEDLHLRNDSNTLWGSFGADLDSDANLPVTDDIDRGARDSSLPDIGADEYGAQTAGSCPAPSLLFSDGFESGDLSAWDASVTATAGDSIVASTLKVYTGTYSARAETDAINEHRAYVYTTFAGQTTASARAHIYLEPGFIPTNFTEVMYFEDGVSSNIIDIEMASDMTLYMWNNVAAESYSSGTMITTGVWHTLEMAAVINGVNGEARMWLDGVLVVDEKGRNLGTNPIARFDLGHFFSGDPNPASILYVDDATVCAEPMSVPPPPTVNYRSIGTAPAYTTGDVTATLGSAIVTGTGAWVTANRGRGDHIDINGDEYTILSVDSETQLTLTSPAIASYTGPLYTISRQYTTLQAWEDCISFNTPTSCSFFQVASADFVADHRKEVGIAYEESAFTSAGGVPIVRIQGSTTDPDHDITLTADGVNRHFGIPGNGVVLNMAAETGSNAVLVQDEFVTVEWLEITGGNGMDAVEVTGVVSPSQVTLRFNLIHDTASGDGIQLRDADLTVDVYNNIIFGVAKGIEINNAVPTSARILNNTIYDSEDGVFADDRVTGCTGCKFDSVLLQNNIAHTFSGGTAGAYFVPSTSATGFATDASSNNLASDATGTPHSAAGGGINGVLYASMNFVSATDLHITSGSAAENVGVDLSSIFGPDIDLGARSTPWDIGADDILATTAVELVSFEAASLNGAAELSWETGAEIDNLGFQLYRSLSAGGPYERITGSLIPGLGSSPEGARYSYRDSGLTNGVTYYYELEDIETTGRTQRHGPVSAIPRETAGTGTEIEASSSSRITYGDPEAISFRVTPRGRDELVLELRTGGFYAEPQEDGSVRVTIPGFEDDGAVPLKRMWLDVLAGRQARVVSVRADEVERVSLRPSEADVTEVVASFDGTVRARTRRGRRAFRAKGLTPSEPARVVEEAYQGETKKALLELAPLRWDPKAGQLLLARRLVVRLSLRKREVSGSRRYRKRPDARAQISLVARERGLYGVRYEEIFSGQRGIETGKLRLSRRGEDVAFHVLPDATRFRQGSTLYFVSDGANANPYGREAVYELEAGVPGMTMSLEDGRPSGAGVDWYWHDINEEENHFYQATQLEAPDPWLWDYVFAPETKRFSFDVDELVTSAQPSLLSVRLQGASDFPVSPDHHVRVWVNGSLAGETSWEGKAFEKLDVELPPGVLREGHNELAVDNVGDTKASYSMVMLDGFTVTYPRRPVSETGVLEGKWDGMAELSGFDAHTYVLDVTEAEPRWLAGAAGGVGGGLRFGTRSGHRYLAVRRDAVLRPDVRPISPGTLTRNTNGADYVIITPEAFLPEVQPLIALRREQGLRAKAVSVESIFSEFGHGESNPEAIREFLSYAYHEWSKPSLRYVVLVGNGTYDFKDFLQTGVKNQVPPMMVKTTYLWTASDPGYAAVKGDDALPDIAIGRLPAGSNEEVHSMVAKILAYERGEAGLDGSVVLVADDADAAGNFEADARSLATGILASNKPETIFLSKLGSARTRQEILTSFDAGASLVSYLGHGGIQLWASENVFNTAAAESLAPQSQQPIVLTMTCLNGYFHFPYFDALSETLVKLEDRGAIAAISPSGLSLNEPAERFQRALLQELFHGNHERLGDAMLAAQSVYTASGSFPELLTIYHLFGDPALGLR